MLVSIQKQIAEDWNEIWRLKVGLASPEFQAMMNISRYIAGPAVALWAVTAIKDLHRNGMANGWQRLAVIVVLVTVLYANNAEIMRKTTLAARQLINYQNTLVLQLANDGASFELKLDEILDYQQNIDAVIEARSQCNSKTTNRELLDCLQEAEAKAQSVIDQYNAAYPGGKYGKALKKYVTNAIEEPSQLIGEAIAVGGATVAAGPVGTIVATGVIVGARVANSAITQTTQAILSSMNSLVQQIVELAWLFTAVIVPIPLALAFYPGGTSALIGWAVGFLTLGLFKINMNMASSIIVGMIYERGGGAGNLDLMLLSVGVIILALGMTAGGGLAIFNGLTTAIAGATLGLVQLSAGSATGGATGPK